jgi:hypothetical protein
VRGKEIADKLARGGSGQQFVGPEPFLGVSRQNIRRKMKRWMEKQHLAWSLQYTETGSGIDLWP